MTFWLRQNDASGSQYVAFEYGAEAPLILDRDRLDEMIEEALQTRKQMTLFKKAHFRQSWAYKHGLYK